MNFAPGTRVGPYEVAALLGSGGMADVYRARDTRLGRDVAIKVIADALCADGPLRERFEREARLAASLSHPNVVALYDVGFQDDKPYLVTELLRGETLRERLRSGRIPLGTVLEWAAQIARGLGAAHDSGIVHRDLKLENVFITRDGQVKLLDFGIAKLVEEVREPHGLMEQTAPHSPWSTAEGAVLGTPGYMSPEQGRGDHVDVRTDIFNFGAVLYEMLCGRPAFTADSIVESAYAILHSEPAPLPVGVAPQVAQVVRRCLEKDPKRRYQSALDLAFHLDLLQSFTGSGFLWNSAARVSAKRRRLRPWLGSAVVILMIGFASGAYFTHRGKSLLPPLVQQMTFRRGAVSEARFTPDGRVVYSAAWGSDSEQIFTRALRSPDTQSLGVTNARLLSVAADGELAVSLRPLWYGLDAFGGTLALVPGIGGIPRSVTENVLYADWSRTGELAVVRFFNGIRQLEYPLGTPLFVTTGSMGIPRVSPGGDSVAFVHRPSGGRVEVLLVDRKGTLRRLTTGGVSGLAWGPNGELWSSEGAAIWATTLTGERRLVYQGVSELQLEDISQDGKVLVNTENLRSEFVFLPPGNQQERELSFQDHSWIAALSDDGRHVLFTSFANREVLTYLRDTDGSPPVKLGSGIALAFSPDGQWVAVREALDRGAISLLPVGVGVSKKLPQTGLITYAGSWLRDGKSLVVAAMQKDGESWQLYLVPLDGSAPRLVSDSVVTPDYVQVSKDDRFAAAIGADGILTVYSLNGGPPLPFPELGKFSVPAGWTADGQLWVSDCITAGHDAPSRLKRFDLQSRRVVEERLLSTTDRTGFVGLSDIYITPDSKVVAYEYDRILGHLYLLEGLIPVRQ